MGSENQSGTKTDMFDCLQPSHTHNSLLKKKERFTALLVSSVVMVFVNKVPTVLIAQLSIRMTFLGLLQERNSNVTISPAPKETDPEYLSNVAN